MDEPHHTAMDPTLTFVNQVVHRKLDGPKSFCPNTAAMIMGRSFRRRKSARVVRIELHQTKAPKPKPETAVAAELTVGVLLFCLASNTDWVKAGVTHATAQKMLVRGDW